MAQQGDAGCADLLARPRQGRRVDRPKSGGQLQVDENG
jgi:hypothetical protein